MADESPAASVPLKGERMKRHQNTTSSAVISVLELTLIGPDGETSPVRGELRYDAHEPYAVTMVLSAGRSLVSWTVGRDLLAQGLLEPVGDGDVHVFPELDHCGRPVVAIELCSSEGNALLEAGAREFHEFLRQTYQVVAPGTESDHLDLDSALSRFLRAGAA